MEARGPTIKTSPRLIAVVVIGLALATAWFLRWRPLDNKRKAAFDAPEQLGKLHELRRAQELATPTATDEVPAMSSQYDPLESTAVARPGQGGHVVQAEAGFTTQSNLELARHVTVSGRVVDAHGLTIAQATVNVINIVDEEQGLRSYEEEGIPVDAKGEFSLDELKAGVVEVSARCDGLHHAKVNLGTLRDGEMRTGVELVLTEGNRVAGRVVQSPGLSYADVQLQIYDETEESGYVVRTDEVGHFVFAGLGPGPFRVWACNAVEDGPLRAVKAITGVVPNTLDLELRLDSPGSIDLTIRGPKSALGPRVVVVDRDGRRADYPGDESAARPSPRVDPTEGGVAITDVWPGEYWLVATDEFLDEPHVGFRRVTIGSGESIKVAVVLEPACALGVSFLNDEDVGRRSSILARGIGGFCFRFGNADEWEGGIHTAGRTLLPPGPYTIEAQCGDKRAVSEVMLVLGSESEIALMLE